MATPKTYNVIITQTIAWDLPIVASSKREALKKAKTYYQYCEDGYTGVASEATVIDENFSISRFLKKYRADEIEAVDLNYKLILAMYVNGKKENTNNEEDN